MSRQHGTSTRTELVCLGLTTLDVVHRIEAPPVWGRKGWATSTELVAGGPAANAAIVAGRLLGDGPHGRPRVTLVTALGDSPAADLVRADLLAHGVRVLDCAGEGASRWTLPVASALVGPDGERTVISPGAMTSQVALSEEASALIAQLTRGSGLLLDGHHPVAARGALEAAGPGVLRILDAGSAKAHAEEWLADLDVVAGSADYARGLGLDVPATLAHVLSAGAGAAIVTDGGGDVVWRTEHTAYWPVGEGTCRPLAVIAVDTLGAGDAFHGALAARLVEGATLGDAVVDACRVAALRVAHAGARGWLDLL